jgi:NADPH:quinone reductase-like Zn-dependent oxidoreductase
VFAAYTKAPDREDPLAALALGDRAAPVPPPGWTTVHMRAASLNMHDVETLRGVRMATDRYPVTLGCDGAGVLADGTEVVVLPAINSTGWVGDPVLDPERTVLSERYPGTFAELVMVPAANLVPKPRSLSFAEAACTGTAWLTAYRMVFVHSGLRPGQDALVLGRPGSIGTAAEALCRAAGIRVWRDTPVGTEPGRGGPGGAVPQFDAVLDAGVDEAEWSHAVRRTKPGGTLVCAGYRSGASRTGYLHGALHDLIFSERRVVGTALGTRTDLVGLLAFLDRTGLRPPIGLQLPLAEIAVGVRAMLDRSVHGKIVFAI